MKYKLLFFLFSLSCFFINAQEVEKEGKLLTQLTPFLSKTYFSVNLGDVFYPFSIFPALRFYLLRTKGFDMYTNYSVIGPTYLTKNKLYIRK